MRAGCTRSSWRCRRHGRRSRSNPPPAWCGARHEDGCSGMRGRERARKGGVQGALSLPCPEHAPGCRAPGGWPPEPLGQPPGPQVASPGAPALPCPEHACLPATHARRVDQLHHALAQRTAHSVHPLQLVGPMSMAPLMLTGFVFSSHQLEGACHTQDARRLKRHACSQC